MISIEIVHAKNPNFLGVYTFHKSMIYIGSKHISDICCPESDLNDIHFFIEVVDGKLILQLSKKTEYLLVNSKRTTKFKNIKPGNIIEACGIKFKILDFSEEQIVTKREQLNQIVGTLQNENPQLLEIISQLSKN